eukprot:m51a1_g12146 hypothetical protein (75) ;mRNA; f:150-374
MMLELLRSQWRMQGLYECRYAIPAATSFRIDILDRSVIDCVSSRSTSISDPDGMNSVQPPMRPDETALMTRLSR